MEVSLKPSSDQIEFAKTMTPRQWRVLRRLVMSPFHFSVSEHADPELFALIEHKLAHTFTPAPDYYGLWSWTATEQGAALCRSQRRLAPTKSRVLPTTPRACGA